MVDKISLPVVIPQRLLISPGVWNNNEYSAKEIGEGFARTEWANKDKISLWLNHDDRNTSAFVGYVKNPTLASEGRVFGDLEIWDEKTAILLTQAMAKFGVSAKIKGEEDKKGKMMNFTFENFSVVTVPACSEAYINLSKKEEKEELTSKYLINILENEDKLDSHTVERGLEIDNMAEEEEKKEEVVEKVEEKEKVEEELSEKDMLKILSEKFDKLITLLSKKLEEEPAEEEEKPVEEPAEEENKELTAVKKELSEIKEKLNAPKSKTVRNLSSNSVGDAKYDANMFCDLLSTLDKPMKFI